MNKIYYLSTCDTCKRIISELGLKEKKFEFQDIKTEKITAPQLEADEKSSRKLRGLIQSCGFKI